MKYFLPTIALATPLLAGLAFATASTAAVTGLSEGDMLGKTEPEIAAALEAMGATINEVEVENDEIEFDVTIDGSTYEIEIDVQTGLISEVEPEDDDSEKDDD